MRAIAVGICVLALPLCCEADGKQEHLKSPPGNFSSSKQADTNDNGKLDASERVALLEARRQARAKFDKNGDGWLNAEERAEARKAMRAKPRPNKENPHDEARRLFQWADANSDGRLDPDEREALYAETAPTLHETPNMPESAGRGSWVSDFSAKGAQKSF